MARKFINADAAVFLTPSFSAFDAFMELVEDFMQHLPTYAPTHWGVVEPISLKLSKEELRLFIKKEKTDIMWQRKSSLKGWGKFSSRYYPLFGPQYAKHYLQVSANRQEQVEALLGYMRHVSDVFGVEYAYCDSVVEAYKPVGRANTFLPFGTEFMTATYRLAKNLPDIVWSQIFGPAYVKLFGLNKLLSAPAYKVEQLGAETVYIQLSESLFDMHDRYEEVDAVRQAVKRHLDDNIFFDSRNPPNHVYRVPEFTFPE